MREVEKEDVLIDICPDCKGVWLDRGELEKITQGLREDQSYSNQAYQSKDRDDRDYRKNDYPKDHDSKYDKQGRPRKRKKSMVDIIGDLIG